ncbi:MAG: hypothetical protein JNK74_23875 [Candidatus Hydrogenedentes bacterium]|nr:hypothetical protein [Candidatus Hydrogenedentota bacterium]
MAKQQQGIAPDVIASYKAQCAALSEDWQRVHALLDAYHAFGADRESLELEYMALRSKLSCDYPVLSYWRKGGFGLSAEINRTLALGSSLASLSESSGASCGTVQKHWQAAWTALRKVMDVLQGAERQIAEGKPAELPPELLVHATHVPFPIRKVLKVLGTVAAVLLVAGTLYVMRNFLGFWAPGAGAGLAVEGMTNAEQIEAVLVTMNEAFKNNDVDRFMTVIADDFQDEEGNGKTKLRVALQAFKEAGELARASVNWSRMTITERDGLIDVRPVYIEAPDGELTIFLGFKSYRGGKLLIATGSAA